MPVIIGSNGVEKIIEINLNEQEKKDFISSINAVDGLFKAAQKIDPALKK